VGAFYGVAVGDFVSFTRDSVDDLGRYFHGHITIRVSPLQTIASAVDVKGYAHDTFWNVSWLLGFDNPLFPYLGVAETEKSLA